VIVLIGEAGEVLLALLLRQNSLVLVPFFTLHKCAILRIRSGDRLVEMDVVANLCIFSTYVAISSYRTPLLIVLS
jgi:hypothetical protein